MSDSKEILLRAFNIANHKLSRSESDLMDKLKEKLLDSSVAEKRRMVLNKDSPEKEDLLADYSLSTGRYIYGVMMRLVPATEVPNIPEDFFKKDKIQMEDLNATDNQVLISCQDHYSFILNNSFLITTLNKKTSISRLQTYLNWILEAIRGATLYELNPKIDKSKIQLSKIKKIELSDPNKIPTKDKKKKESYDTSNKIINLAKESVGYLCGGISNINEIMDSNIVSAKLVVKFARPQKMTVDDYENELSAILKPMSNLENLSVTGNDGKKVKGEDIPRTKSVNIQTIDENGLINEQTLIQEMEKFLIDLNEE